MVVLLVADARLSAINNRFANVLRFNFFNELSGKFHMNDRPAPQRKKKTTTQYNDRRPHAYVQHGMRALTACQQFNVFIVFVLLLQRREVWMLLSVAVAAATTTPRHCPCGRWQFIYLTVCWMDEMPVWISQFHLLRFLLSCSTLPLFGISFIIFCLSRTHIHTQSHSHWVNRCVTKQTFLFPFHLFGWNKGVGT